MDIEDLVGRETIVERLKVAPVTVKEWAGRETFPTPITKFGRQFIYLWPEVLAWHEKFEATKSRGGRPRTVPHPVEEERCGVLGCRNKRETDYRGNLRPFCRKHMDQFRD